MEQEKAEPLTIGRRKHSRLRLRVPATFTSLHGFQQVVLDDLSQTGAQITFPNNSAFSRGLLKWLEFEVLAHWAWQEGSSCGLRFDEPIGEAWVLETRMRAPGMLDVQKKRLRTLAKNWTEGASDW